MSRELRRKTLDAIRDLNEVQLKTVGDAETLTRIAQYELAFRMQMSVPDVMDISKEPQHILDLYGAKPGLRFACRVRLTIREFFTRAMIRRSQIIVCWLAGWSSAACGSYRFTTGAGTITAHLPASHAMRRCRSSASRSTAPWRA